MPKDITNNKYGKLLVLELDHIVKYEKPPQTKAYWLCKCDCGNRKIVRGEHLTNNKIISCGCVARSNAAKRLQTHGMTRTRTYRIWGGMKSRCLNKHLITLNSKLETYKNVMLCDRWYVFENFLNDMGVCPSNKHEIDRIDPNGNYEPGNCRWATRREQMLNQKRNHKFYKEYLSLSSTIPYKMYRQRVLVQGWDKIQAATTPKMKNQFG